MQPADINMLSSRLSRLEHLRVKLEMTSVEDVDNITWSVHRHLKHLQVHCDERDNNQPSDRMSILVALFRTFTPQIALEELTVVCGLSRRFTVPVLPPLLAPLQSLSLSVMTIVIVGRITLCDDDWCVLSQMSSLTSLGSMKLTSSTLTILASNADCCDRLRRLSTDMMQPMNQADFESLSDLSRLEEFKLQPKSTITDFSPLTRLEHLTDLRLYFPATSDINILTSLASALSPLMIVRRLSLMDHPHLASSHLKLALRNVPNLEGLTLTCSSHLTSLEFISAIP